MGGKCPYSGTEVEAQIDPSIPVECPVCGAIRKAQVWSSGFKYPSHEEVEFVKPRRCWTRSSGAWKIKEVNV